MVTDGRAPEVRADYKLAGAGAALAAVAVPVGVTAGAGPVGAAAAVVGVVGMLVAGFAVARRPRDSGVLGLAATTALFAYFATSPAWDAIRIMMGVMAAVAAVAAVLLLLPRTVQRVAVSLFVLYHFCGIL